MTARTLFWGAALIVASLPLTPIGAQQIRLTISGHALTQTQTPPSDFDAGAIIMGTTSFEVDVRTNGPTKATTVSVRCTPACPATGALSLANLQWRRIDLGTWNTLTTSHVAIETRNATRNVLNDPWSNSIEWRYLLTWTGSPPTAPTSSRFNIEYQLTVAAP